MWPTSTREWICESFTDRHRQVLRGGDGGKGNGDSPGMDIAGRINGWLRRIPAWPLYVLLLIPAVLEFQAGLSGHLGPDPVKAIERQYGLWALQLLLAGLAVTPIRRFCGINLLRFRRAIGLMAFLYVCLHLSVWLILDLGLFWPEIWADIVKRPYITIGMGAFLALVPLAVTSNDRSLRAIGAMRWRRLHRLIYVIVPAAAIHYLMLVKTWQLAPMLYLSAALLLLLLRVRPARRMRSAA